MKEWSFCPYCGARINKQNFLNNIDKLVKGVLNNFFNGNLKMKSLNNKVRIKIISPTRIKKETRIKQEKPKPIRMPEKLIEPKTNINYKNKEIEIIVELPGIKSLNEVSVIRMGESIEIRAVIKDKGYFKVISVPLNYEVINKSINNELLLVRLKGK